MATLDARSPITGELLATVPVADPAAEPVANLDHDGHHVAVGAELAEAQDLQIEGGLEGPRQVEVRHHDAVVFKVHPGAHLGAFAGRHPRQPAQDKPQGVEEKVAPHARDAAAAQNHRRADAAGRHHNDRGPRLPPRPPLPVGHTHRPAVHSLDVDSRPVRRVVLGDWYAQGSVLAWSREGYELVSLPR